MDVGYIAQYFFNGLMLGLIYAMVAIGFSLFFGALDVIMFSHGDVVTAGAFAGLGAAVGVTFLGSLPAALILLAGLTAALAVGALAGGVIGAVLVLPLRKAPPVNVLLATLMAGTALRELIRLGVPNGGNPKPFPSLLPAAHLRFGTFDLGIDSVIILLSGLAVTCIVYVVVTRSRFGLAIRAVAQEPVVAQLAGINFRKTVLGTFALGSALAGFAGIMLGLYYHEINFDMGVLLGVIGFAAAVVGGLGNLLGAVLGGFLFAAVQTIAAIALPFSSAYKDVIAFAVVIVAITLFPTGLIAEKTGERV